MMEAIILGAHGVELALIEMPIITENQVLIEVYSSSVNRSDLLETHGQSFGHLSGKQKILGATCSGKIVEIGSNISGFSVGDKVVAQGSGGWAQFCAADYRRVLPIPSPEMSLLQAGTYNSAVLTMHDAIVTHGQFKKGQTIFIQGASSGVGLMGLQIAKYLGAKTIFGSSRDKSKFPIFEKYHADICIDISQDDWQNQILNATEQQGVDLVIDQLSGIFASANLNITKVGGRIINVGRLSGQQSQFDFNKHAERRITYIGTTGRTRDIHEHEQVAQSAYHDLWNAISTNDLQMPIDCVFGFKDVDKALQRMAENQHLGRIMLEFKQE